MSVPPVLLEQSNPDLISTLERASKTDCARDIVFALTLAQLTFMVHPHAMPPAIQNMMDLAERRAEELRRAYRGLLEMEAERLLQMEKEYSDEHAVYSFIHKQDQVYNVDTRDLAAEALQGPEPAEVERQVDGFLSGAEPAVVTLTALLKNPHTPHHQLSVVRARLMNETRIEKLEQLGCFVPRVNLTTLPERMKEAIESEDALLLDQLICEAELILSLVENGYLQEENDEWEGAEDQVSLLLVECKRCHGKMVEDACEELERLCGARLESKAADLQELEHQRVKLQNVFELTTVTPQVKILALQELDRTRLKIASVGRSLIRAEDQKQIRILLQIKKAEGKDELSALFEVRNTVGLSQSRLELVAEMLAHLLIDVSLQSLDKNERTMLTTPEPTDWDEARVQLEQTLETVSQHFVHGLPVELIGPCWRGRALLVQADADPAALKPAPLKKENWFIAQTTSLLLEQYRLLGDRRITKNRQKEGEAKLTALVATLDKRRWRDVQTGLPDELEEVVARAEEWGIKSEALRRKRARRVACGFGDCCACRGCDTGCAIM
eukprot:TRINITY_DN22646_c0_g1_i2.p1 TRINITY_DN22646_c0_g1~~TRINITY_DN22646_c0_g1_i2.p1  ORF type:complete len:555 (+),score=146.53 TRINITY_DN22646_c0_g1_i2:2-1666(+)